MMTFAGLERVQVKAKTLEGLRGVKPFRNFYEVLGISRGASQDDIRKAHRRMVREHHPDANPGDGSAEGRFKEI